MGEAFIIKRGNVLNDDIDLTIVGSTTQPSNPTENTIWVNTDTPINGYAFSATEPENPVESMVWFEINTNSSAAMNINKENMVMLYPSSCSQYINGAWVTKDVQAFLNGKWINLRTYFYNKGDECIDLTGSWLARGVLANSSGQGSKVTPTITKEASYMNIVFGTKQYGVGIVYTTNKIDLTEFSSLCVKGEFVSTKGTRVSIALFQSIPTHQGQAVAKAQFPVDIVGTMSKTLDVSEMSGEYYITLLFYNPAVDGCTFNLTEYYGEV